MHCSDNNRGTTVLQQFANAVREYECVPLRIRTDKGVEKMQVGVYMHHVRADIDNPVLVGERLSFQTESGGRPPYLSSGNGHKISSVKRNRRSVQLLLKHKDLSGTKNIAMVILSGLALNCTVMKI